MTCTGKGRKYRATPLTAATLTVLVPYLAERATRPGAAAFPWTTRTAPVPRRARTTTGQARGHRHRTVSLAGVQARHHAHPAAHRGHAGRSKPASTTSPSSRSGLGYENTASTDVYLHADMTIKQAAIDRTRGPQVTPGTYAPGPDVLAFLTSL